MSKDGVAAFSHILWERFPESKEYYVCSTTEAAPRGLTKVRIGRNENYQIEVDFEGDDVEKWDTPPAAFELEAGNHPKYPQFRIENCLIYASSIHVPMIKPQRFGRGKFAHGP